MKALTDEDIHRIAKLANLTVRDDEIEKFRTQLSSILEYIGKLNELDTSKISPTNQVTGLSSVTREDITTSVSLSQTNALKNSSSISGNAFKVAAIFEE